LAGGCVVGPDYQRPDAPTPSGFREQPPPDGNWKPAEPGDQAMRGRWWELFGDPQLDALEAKIAVSNQTLKAAAAQYFAALDQVRVARAAYFPTLGAGASATRLRLSENQPNTVRGATRFNYNLFVLQGQAQWEPDLWGQVRRTVEQARAQAQANAADLAQAETQYRTVKAQGIDTGVARAQFEHAIATLVGVPPSAFSLPPNPAVVPLPAV